MIRELSSVSRWAVLATFALAGCSSMPAEEEPVAEEPVAVDVATTERFQRGREAVFRGDFQTGLDELQAVLGELPEGEREVRGEAHAWIAHIHIQWGDPERSLEHARRATELDPEDPWRWYAQGIALSKMGDYGSAESVFNEALRLDPLHFKSLQWRGDSYYYRKRYEEALADYDRVFPVLEQLDDATLELSGERRVQVQYNTLLQRADALDALKRHDEAKLARERAASLR